MRSTDIPDVWSKKTLQETIIAFHWSLCHDCIISHTKCLSNTTGVRLEKTFSCQFRAFRKFCPLFLCLVPAESFPAQPYCLSSVICPLPVFGFPNRSVASCQCHSILVTCPQGISERRHDCRCKNSILFHYSTSYSLHQTKLRRAFAIIRTSVTAHRAYSTRIYP